MGSTCQLCPKDPVDFALQSCTEILTNQPQKEQPITRFVKTSFFSMNTQFYISTQSVRELNAQYLLVLTDSLAGISYNPLIAELGSYHVLGLEQKIDCLKKKVSFCRAGDTLIVPAPFSQLRINNLIIGWVPLREGSQQKLQIYIDSLFQAMNLSGETLSLGIVQISPNLGYNYEQFQRIIVTKLNKLSKQKQKLRITYCTYNRDRVDSFVEEILCARSVIGSQFQTFHSQHSREISSTYF